MGQFLGFSHDHSSLVMNARNLQTGYIIFLFHVVFDDLFQAIFSLGDNDMVYDYAYDCDSVGPKVVETDPDPSTPVIVSEEDQYNHCKDPFTP